MDLLIATFNTILYRPLFNILVLFYQYIPGRDFGLAVIVLTILIKLIFYPLGIRAIKSQRELSKLQPKIKEIQEKYKDNKEEQSRELIALYKKEKINPLSGCLPLLIQFPVLIALYRVFWRGLQPEQMVLLYSFIPNPGLINPNFLGIVDLSQPNTILAVIAGVFQFLQVKLAIPKQNPSSKKDDSFSGHLQKQMQYFMPIFMVVILLRLPSAIGLYWICGTAFTIAQQYVILKKKNGAGKFAKNQRNNQRVF